MGIFVITALAAALNLAAVTKDGTGTTTAAAPSAETVVIDTEGNASAVTGERSGASFVRMNDHDQYRDTGLYLTVQPVAHDRVAAMPDTPAVEEDVVR